MSRSDRFALVLSLAAVLVVWFVTERFFQGIPHIEDEMAYTWQAKLLAEGAIKISSPPDPKSFLVPFVVDYRGYRFGKYPLGWPVVLALGTLLGARDLVNPLLAGLGVWLTYLLGKRIFNERIGLLAAALTIPSPFFLMNSGSLLSHPLGLVESLAFAILYFKDFGEVNAPRKWSRTIGLALILGFMFLTRPLTAVAVALPFAIHSLYLMFAGNRQTRYHLIILAIVTLGLSSLLPAWQYYVTGDPLLNPYTLWWPYDKIGFGPGIGVVPTGHSLSQAYVNTRYSLIVGAQDLFGWGMFSWIFAPFGLLAFRRNWKGLLSFSVVVSLVVFYLAYWVGASLYGPRYFYEGLFGMTLVSAAGIAWLAGWPVGGLTMTGKEHLEMGFLPSTGLATSDVQEKKILDKLKQFLGEKRLAWDRACRLRSRVTMLILAGLVISNAVAFLPVRLGGFYNLYGINRENLRPFQDPAVQAAFAPALIIVHSDKWMPYGNFIDLENPELTTPFIFAWTRGADIDAQVAKDFPSRAVYHYYPDTPGKFYTAPRK